MNSLFVQSLNKNDFEILVANDGGNKAVSDLCRQSEVRELKIIPHKGSYHARNVAIENASYQAFAFVDADIYVPADWLLNGLNSLKNAHYVAGPVKINRSNNMSIAELYEYYTAFNVAKYIDKYKFGVTANVFVRKEVFDLVGYFDEGLRSSGDLEFGDRVFRSGRFIQRYDKKLEVYHPARKYRELVKKIKRGSEGQVVLKRKYPERFEYINHNLLFTAAKVFLPPKKIKINRPEDKNKAVSLYFFSWYVKFLKSYFIMKSSLE